MDKLFWIVLLTVSLPPRASAEEAAEICDQVTKAFYNVTSTKNSGSFSSDVTSWLRSKAFQEFMKSSKFGFSLSLPLDTPLNFGAGSSDTDYQKLQSALDAGTAAKLNSEFASSVAKQLVDSKSIDAWSECIDKTTRKGLYGSIEKDPGDVFVLLLRWYPSLAVNDATVSTVTVMGAKYDSETLKPGLKIGSEWISVLVQRSSASETVALVVNTVGNIGSIAKIVPPHKEPAPEKKVVSPKERCSKEELVGCIEYAQLRGQECGIAPGPGDSWAAAIAYNGCQSIKVCYDDRVIALSERNRVCAQHPTSLACSGLQNAVSKWSFSDCDGMATAKRTF